jgi:hypothetical protein
VFCQDPYQIIEHRCESFCVTAESAPVAEPKDRFVVRSRDGQMLFSHGDHDRRRLGPFEKQRPVRAPMSTHASHRFDPHRGLDRAAS